MRQSCVAHIARGAPVASPFSLPQSARSEMEEEPKKPAIVFGLKPDAPKEPSVLDEERKKHEQR